MRLTINLLENPQKYGSEKLLAHAIIVRVTLLAKLIQNVSGRVRTLFCPMEQRVFTIQSLQRN